MGKRVVGAPAGGRQVQAHDADAKDDVVQKEVGDADRYQQQGPLRVREIQHVVKESRGEREAQMHPECIHEHHREAGRDCVQGIQHRGQKHEGKFHGLGNAGEEGG